MDPSEAARAEGTLEVEVGETISALLSTLIWKCGFVHGTRVIYAFATLAAFACALCGDGTAMFEVSVRCYGNWKVLN